MLIFRFFITLLILLFILETKFDFIQAYNYSIRFPSEISLLSILQSLVLSLNLIINLRFRKYFLEFFQKVIFIFRLGIFSFLLYEENSFLTNGIDNYITSINSQGEVNFHNLSFLKLIVFENNYFSLSYQTIFYTICLLFIGYGSYLPRIKKFRILFLERKYSIYFLFYFFIEIINSVFVNLTGGHFISHEFLELIIYLILLMDSFEKIKILKLKYKNKRF